MVKRKWKVDPAVAGKEMSRIADEIAQTVPLEKSMDAVLVFEEVFVNVAKHAYEQERVSKPLSIELVVNEKAVFLSFWDYGAAFDPTAYNLDTPQPTQIGGHGIRLIKNLAKEIGYQRIGNQNCLQISL